MNNAITDELYKLKALLDDGVLTQDEFDGIKARIIQECTPKTMTPEASEEICDDLFLVSLQSIKPQMKIQTISIIREITGMGLAAAKSFVESTPQVVKRGIDKEMCERIRSKLASVGAVITIEKDNASIEKDQSMDGFQFRSEKQVMCPICRSLNISTTARGVNWTWGLVGASKTVNRCANCGHTWKPKG